MSEITKRLRELREGREAFEAEVRALATTPEEREFVERVIAAGRAAIERETGSASDETNG